MPLPTSRYSQWLAAEREAQAAQRELRCAMLAGTQGPSAPALAELALALQARWETAHALFEKAMQEFKVVAESLDHRHLDFTPAASAGPPTGRAGS